MVSGCADVAITTYYGENAAAAGTLAGAPVTARASFMAALIGTPAAFGFEANSLAQALPIVAAFTGAAPVNVTITGTGTVQAEPTIDPISGDPVFSGRFNTTPAGQFFLETKASVATPTVFTPEVGKPIAAFGFYATDVNDASGSLLACRLTSEGGVVTTINIKTTAGANGNLLFWGFVDGATRYTRIELLTNGATGNTTDVFGFDDFVVALASQVQPAPDFWPAGCQAWPAGLPAR